MNIFDFRFSISDSTFQYDAIENLKSKIQNPYPRGLTLVEVMITLMIFVTLAGFTVMTVREVVAQWTLGERRRVLYEKAAGVLDIMADDIRLAVTREPAGVTENKVRFIGDYDAESRQQRLVFVRSFESGPERAITFNAGDGKPNDMVLKPAADGSGVAAAEQDPATAKGGDAEEYTGLKVGDFKALGGMAMIAYFANKQTLYRVIHAPVPLAFKEQLTPQNAQALATDALYLGFDYWSQNTQGWDMPKNSARNSGPERIWDSTRAISEAPFNHFSLHRGPDSADDADDDVFPEKVRITVTVDSPMPRCVYATLLEKTADTTGGLIFASSTKGFNDGDDQDPFILIDEEWLHYRNKTAEGFEIDQRGARGTLAKGHAVGAVIRQGRTFRRVVYIPNWREDTMPDEQWRAWKAAQKNAPRTIVQPPPR